MLSAVERFRAFANEKRFKGWPILDDIKFGPEIDRFGQEISWTEEITLRDGSKKTNRGNAILRHFGWAVVFGVTEDRHVPTLCQWKRGVNCASWELPPGGIGKVPAGTSHDEILSKTKQEYMNETGLGGGEWDYLGHILVETGKYRGAGPNDNGLPAHLFVAQGLAHIQDAQNPHPHDILEAVMVPISEFREVLESGLFVEESAVACAYKALAHIGLLRWS